MGKVVDALIDGTPLGKLVWDAIGVDAWWEIGVGKYVREALIPIPDDDFGNEAMSQQQMLRSPTEARRSIYGKAMVSGPIVFAAETGTDNEYLHLVIPLAAHQCADVLEIYFDDEVVYQNGSLDTAYSKHARINIHLGTQTAADSDLLAECEHWTASHIGLGITYLYVRLKHDPEFYANGLPNIKALVQGKPLYDPRKDSTVGGSGSHRWDDESSWEWSDNWALCVLDYTRFESGVGALVNEIDLPSYALAANDSDQLVEYDDEGNTEKRYTCNGTFTQSMTPASVLDKLLTAGAGMQTYSSGKYQLFSGVYQGPHLLTIGEADLAGEVEVRPFNARAQLCNAVRGTFVDPDNFYQPTDFAPYESDYYRAQDNCEYIDHDIDLPFTQSAYTAQRLAKLHLELNRAGQQIVAPLNMIGLSVSVGQVVELDLPRLGIKAEYQVMDWQFDFGQPIKVTLRETGPALFDYDKGSYTDRKLTPVLNLPSSKRVPTVTGVLWTPMGDDANWQGLLAWNAPGGNSAYRYRLEVSNGLNVVVYQATIDGTRHHIPKLDAGNYTITLWAVNLFANRSNVPATIAIGADAPPAVTGILVDTGALELTLRPQTAAITATTTEFEVKGGLSSDISNAQFIGQGKEVIWPGRHANTQYFVWARATNNFGTSAWFGPIIAHTTSDKSAIVDLLGNTFDKYTWFAWADDKQGTGFTTDEAIGDGKAYLGQAINKDTATPSGNWQDYTWSKIQTDIPELFTPAEEAALDNLMAGKLPTGDKDMLALQDALNDPSLSNNLLTAQQLLNQGINAAGLGGETPTGAQSKADAARDEAILKARNNLLDLSGWVLGAADNFGSFSRYYGESSSINQVKYLPGPFGAQVPVWEFETTVNQSPSGSWGGGFRAYLSGANYNPKKAYRFCCWIKRSSLSGYTYMGYDSVWNLGSTTLNANPYAINSNNPPAADTWYLLVAVIHGSDYAGTDNSGLTGYWDPNTGKRVFVGNEYRTIADDNSLWFRMAQYRTDSGTKTQYYAPLLQALDGTETPISAILLDPAISEARAIAAAAADATSKADSAQSAAEAYALAKANLAETQAKAYADGVVDAEEARAIADAQAKADAAKAAAIAAAATDATTKANNAKAQAEANAALDAQNKATAARSGAVADAKADPELANNTTANGVTNIPAPLGGSISYNSNPIIGAIKIALPQSYTSTMLRFTVDVFTYEGDKSFSVQFAGYNYQSGSYWANCTAKIIGDSASNHQVRFGNENGKCCVWIGNTGDRWVYPKVLVRDVFASYNAYDLGRWASGWLISIESAFGTVDVVLSDNLVGSQYAKTQAENAQSAAEAYALAKANLAEVQAKAYADGVVDAEEARAIADAQAKADAAKAAAIAAAAADATTKANSAVSSAVATAEETSGRWTRNYVASATLHPELLGRDGASLPQYYSTTYGATTNTKAVYDVTMVTTGTVTVTKTVGQLAWNGAAWEWTLISAVGQGSNHPGILIENGKPVVITWHGNNYTIAVAMSWANISTNIVRAGQVMADAITANELYADTALITKLIANQALFNQVKSRLGTFGGLTAETIAALAIATNHLQAGAVTSDKVTADTALINKLIASQGLFDALQARFGVFGGLAAQSIAAKAISTDKLAVTARNLVNNVSQTGVMDGWNGSTISIADHTHNGSQIKVIESTVANLNSYNYSNYFDVDNTKIYQVDVSIHRVSGGLNGHQYFGLLANGELVTRYNASTRQIIGTTTNPYFWTGDLNDGETRQIRTYIVGSEVDKDSIPETLNASEYFQLNPGIKVAGLRIMNYMSGTSLTGVTRFFNITVTELGGGQISANQLLANSALFNQLKAKIASFGGLTATEILADTALINKLVGSSALFNELQARLAVFGGLTANSIAAGAILGNHIKAGEKITSPIIEGGELRLVGSSFMKVSAATAFGPDGLIEWYGPKLLVGGNPDWANLKKSNAITYLAANGDAYFGGSLSAGILKNSVATSDKNKYEAGTAPVSLGPFSTNGRTKVVVVSFDMRASTRYSSNPGSVSAPVLKWQLQKLINGNWTSLTSGTYQGTASVYFENDDPSNTYWQESQSCQGSTTYTDTSTSSADVTYRILVTSYYRNATNGVIERQILSIISTEQ
jgi:hypothetical protein